MSPDIQFATEGTIEEAARHVRRGGLVVFPTETYYALGCNPQREDAVDALFELKAREAIRALPLVAGTREQVELAAPGWMSFARAVRLADAFWPGPLSLVLPGTPRIASRVRGADGTVAVRWSSHAVAAALAVAAGFPVVATSANRSGSQARRYAAEALASLGNPDGVYTLDAGATTGGLPSTLVDVTLDPLRIVRAGAIDERSIRRAL